MAGLEERNRLARELHDSVKQQVFAATMNLGATEALWDPDPAGAYNKLTEQAAAPLVPQTKRTYRENPPADVVKSLPETDAGSEFSWYAQSVESKAIMTQGTIMIETHNLTRRFDTLEIAERMCEYRVSAPPRSMSRALRRWWASSWTLRDCCSGQATARLPARSIAAG